MDCIHCGREEIPRESGDFYWCPSCDKYISGERIALMRDALKQDEINEAKRLRNAGYSPWKKHIDKDSVKVNDLSNNSNI